MEKVAGYKYLLTYQLAIVISTLTVKFCDKFLSDFKFKRTVEQKVQAARSGKQNIVEGFLEKSLKNYIYLLGISLGSFGELGEDYQEQYLLRKQINALEEKFVTEGGFTENLYKKRIQQRKF